MSVDTERDADVDREVAALVGRCEAEIQRQRGAIKLYKEFAWLATTLRDQQTAHGIRRLLKLRAELLAGGFVVPFDPVAT